MGAGYKIIGGTGDSGIADELAPLAAQNKVIYISGAAADDTHHRDQPLHVPFRSPDLPGREDSQVLRAGARYRQDRPRAGPGLRLWSVLRHRRDERLQGSRRHRHSLLVPLTTTDFTSVALQVAQQTTPTSSFWRGPARPGRH